MCWNDEIIPASVESKPLRHQLERHGISVKRDSINISDAQLEEFVVDLINRFPNAGFSLSI